MQNTLINVLLSVAITLTIWRLIHDRHTKESSPTLIETLNKEVKDSSTVDFYIQDSVIVVYKGDTLVGYAPLHNGKVQAFVE